MRVPNAVITWVVAGSVLPAIVGGQAPVTAPAPAPSSASGAASVARLAVGTDLYVRLQPALGSGASKVSERFDAAIAWDYSIGGRVAVPAGSPVRGFLGSVRPAGIVDRRGSVTLSFDDLRIEPHTYRLRATVTQIFDGQVAEDVARMGTSAIVSANASAFTGMKGTLVGVVVGPTGSIIATEGANADLPAGTVLRIRLDQPIDLIAP